jgi:hypothetical protein
MVDKSKQTSFNNCSVSSNQLVNLSFKVSSLPKPQQEYQFTVTHQDARNKSFATPTSYIELPDHSNK